MRRRWRRKKELYNKKRIETVKNKKKKKAVDHCLLYELYCMCVCVCTARRETKL